MTAPTEFRDSTRGRILLHLLRERLTIAALAERLEISTNAVRRHLTNLERDGYVERGRLAPTSGAPAAVYEITRAGAALFPAAYAEILAAAASVLEEEFHEDGGEFVMGKIGMRLAKRFKPATSANIEERIEATLDAFDHLGAVVDVSRNRSGVVTIRGHVCPVSAVVADHPGFCTAMASMIEDITYRSVEVRCDRDDDRDEAHNHRPRCCFVVGETGA